MKYLLLSTLFSLTIALNNAMAQEDKAYGLNFVGSEIRFAELDLTDGSVEILSNGPITPDLLQQGVADFNPIDKSYFYIRGNSAAQYLIQVDALTGELIGETLLDNPNGAVAPITNIAFNWLDDKIYGVSHEFNGITEVLNLVVLDPATGIIEQISEEPVSLGPYLSGNSDIDPIHRKYHYITTNTLYSVDLDTGESTSIEVNFPPNSNPQSLVNIAYNWIDLQLYGLQFLSIPDPDIFDEDYFTSELRLSKIDMETGAVTVISEDPISNDGFSMGDCDIDPTNNRYFYIRQNAIHIVDLTTGDPISIIPIENPNNAIAPILNMAFDDLAIVPPSLIMDMEPTLFLAPNEPLEVDVWVGNDVNYLWNDGVTSPIRTIDQPGAYNVEIKRNDFTINASTVVEISTAINSTDLNKSLTINPTIASNFINIYLEGQENADPISFDIIDNSGKIRRTDFLSNELKNVDISFLENGLYYLKSNAEAYPFMGKFVINR